MEYHFDIGHAMRWGVEEAIMLHNLIYWCRHNKANGTNQRDGKSWTYNSVRAFEVLFPFWKEYQIRRVIQSLISQKVIIRGKYNLALYDKTSWYALVDESLLELDEVDAGKGNAPIRGNHRMDLTKSPDGFDEIPGPIPDLNPDGKHRWGMQGGDEFDPADEGGIAPRALEGAVALHQEPTEEEVAKMIANLRKRWAGTS